MNCHIIVTSPDLACDLFEGFAVNLWSDLVKHCVSVLGNFILIFSYSDADKSSKPHPTSPLSVNPAKWSNTLKQFELFEYVWPFCEVCAYKVKIKPLNQFEVRVFLGQPLMVAHIVP